MYQRNKWIKFILKQWEVAAVITWGIRKICRLQAGRITNDSLFSYQKQANPRHFQVLAEWSERKLHLKLGKVHLRWAKRSSSWFRCSCQQCCCIVGDMLSLHLTVDLCTATHADCGNSANIWPVALTGCGENNKTRTFKFKICQLFQNLRRGI